MNAHELRSYAADLIIGLQASKMNQDFLPARDVEIFGLQMLVKLDHTIAIVEPQKIVVSTIGEIDETFEGQKAPTQALAAIRQRTRARLPRPAV